LLLWRDKTEVARSKVPKVVCVVSVLWRDKSQKPLDPMFPCTGKCTCPSPTEDSQRYEERNLQKLQTNFPFVQAGLVLYQCSP
jgi:hypothetical protein